MNIFYLNRFGIFAYFPYFCTTKQTSHLMNITEFTDIFLPNLLALYIDGELPFHSLVDTDLWKQVFPETTNTDNKPNILWYQIQLNSFALQDGTLLLTYTLPEPSQANQPKFVGIRLNRETNEAVYYVLYKPKFYDDQWDIWYLPLPQGQQKMKLEFKCKIDGTSSLRNFVFTVQQLNFSSEDYGTTLMDIFKRRLKDAISTQD